MDLQQAVRKAAELLRTGRIDDAESICRQILIADPDCAPALEISGLLAQRRGSLDEAARLAARAVELAPKAASAHNTYGEICRVMGRSEDAIGAYRRAVGLRPDFADAHANLGQALLDANNPTAAAESCRNALRLNPSHFRARQRLGVALRKQGKLTEAIKAFEAAVVANASYALGHASLASALTEDGRFANAMEHFRRALELDPNNAATYANCADALRVMGRADEAMRSCEAALRLDPRSALALSVQSAIWRDQGKLDEAESASRRAIEFDETCVPADERLGNALLLSGRAREAIEAIRRALAIDPSAMTVHSNLLLAMHYPDGIAPEDIFAEHLRFAERFAHPLRDQILPHENSRDPQRRLRIGYLSGDFREHPAGRCIEPILTHLDRGGFETVCYNSSFKSDAMTRRLKSLAGAWRDAAAMNDRKLAQLIRDDRIDILVDLTGHTNYSRILVLALKPAPILVGHFGYSDTTGLGTVDYQITDETSDPTGQTERFWTEKLVRLPEAAWCWAPPADAPEPVCAPAGESGIVTFGSCNNFAKVSDATAKTWAETLRRVPNSRLIVFVNAITHGGFERRHFTEHGVDAERLTLVARVSKSEYFARLREIDIALDPFPYNGGVTTCDALWMGLPVIALRGRTYVSRQGVSLLTQVGLSEVIADTPADYVRVAGELAGDFPRLNAIREGLRARFAATAVVDGRRYAAQLAEAFRTMWRTWCAANPPSPSP
ncbi:MAG: tetratricopeptide repeat protein [Tepidisphaeraceae bacterium]